MAAAIPIIASIGGSIGGGLIGRKTSMDIAKQGRELTPEERRAFEGGMGSAGQLGDMGSQLYGSGQKQLGQAGSYYETLLRGDRGAMQQAVAGPAEQIGDIYGGASRSIRSGSGRGGVQEQQLAEIEREKAGRISRLTAGVQPGAAESLGRLGMFQTGTGVGATQAGGNLLSRLLGISAGSRRTGLEGMLAGHQIGQDYGGNIGNLLFEALRSANIGGGKGKGVSGGVPPGLPPGYPRGAGLPTHPGNLPGG